MRFLVVNPFAGAQERQRLWETIRVRSGWEVGIITAVEWINDYGRRIRASKSEEFGGELIPVPVRLRGNIPLHFFTRDLAPIINRFRPDWVYVYHEPYGVATLQAFLANRRSVRAPIAFYSSQNIHKRYPLPFRQAERFVYRAASLAVAVSETVASVLRAKGYNGAVAVVPFGVDPQEYRPTRSRPFSSDALRVGYVGRLVPEKGVDTLLSALATAGDARIRLAVVGEGPDLMRLQALSAHLGVGERVSWLGYQPPTVVPSIISGFDVLVVPSKTTARWREQFGRVVIEALACGTPVIVSDSGELPHLVHDIRGGWVFPEGDSAALAGLIQQLHRSPRMLDGASHDGMRIVRSQYTTHAVADRLITSFIPKTPVVDGRSS